MDANLKCQCSHCGGWLEFESAHLGAEVECPHCQKATTLRDESGATQVASGGRAGKSRRVLVAVASVVLVISAAGAGAAFYKMRGAKKADSVGAENSAASETPRKTAGVGAASTADAAMPESSSAAMVVPQMAAFQAGLSSAQIREGRDAFYWKCTECHHLYDPSIYGDKQWDSIFGNMRGKAKLSGSQAEAISVFVRSIRGG
jgi:hypothetical protein